MDFDEMQNRVYSVLRDDQKEFVKDWEVEAWLNEAQEDVAHRLKILQAEASGTVGALQTLALPADLVDIMDVWIDGADIGVEWVDSYQFNKYRGDINVPITTIGRIFNGRVEIRPKPAVGAAYTIRYIKTPTALVNAADVSELPVELHMKLVHYARYQAKLKESELGDADRYQAEYERGLPPHPLAQARLNPGPMSLRYRPGPFDAIGVHRG